jgi:hypothetical protein
MWQRSALIGWGGRGIGMIALTWALLTGCASQSGTALQLQEAFPPLQVIERRDYKNFLTANQRSLAQCSSRMGCDIILLNLGFIYAYPHSPYRDPQKARQYLQELQNRYPSSPWAMHGRVLLAFMTDLVSAEEAQRRLRTELRSRDVTIRTLRDQLQRSREIDFDIDKKERDLLR